MRVVHVVSSDLAPAHAARVRAFIRRLDGEGALSCAEMPPVRSGGRRATTRARLIDRLWSLEPDIVHVHGRGAGASVMPAASWLCAPVVLSPAPCDCRRAPDPLRRMLRARSWSRLVRGCAGLIFTSDGARAAWFEAGGSDACGIVGVCAVPLVAAVLAPLNAEVDAASRAVDEDRDQRLIAVGCRPDSPLGRMLRDAGVRLAADGFRIAPATDPRVARRAGVFVAPDVG